MEEKILGAIEALNKKIIGLDARFDSIDEDFNTISGNLALLNQTVRNHSRIILESEERLAKIDGNIGSIYSEIRGHDEEAA